MWCFEKKKIYKVEYKDEWGNYGCTVVKAKDEADAWKKARKQHCPGSPYRANVLINIVELRYA